MKIIRCIGVAAMAVILAAPAARAQMVFELTPYMGGTYFVSDLPSQFALSDDRVLENGRFKRSFVMGVNTGVRIDDDWAVEGSFAWLPMNLRASSGLRRTADVNAFEYGLNGLYYLPGRGSARPFMGLGVGRTTYDYQIAGVETRSEWSGSVLAGIRVDVSDRSGLRFQVRDSATRLRPRGSGANRWSNAVSVSMGLSIRAD